ncbi:hypothetical protein LXL04_023220 [Taraxacum kok-saghyz]
MQQVGISFLTMLLLQPSDSSVNSRFIASVAKSSTSLRNALIWINDLFSFSSSESIPLERASFFKASDASFSKNTVKKAETTISAMPIEQLDVYHTSTALPLSSHIFNFQQFGLSLFEEKGNSHNNGDFKMDYDLKYYLREYSNLTVEVRCRPGNSCHRVVYSCQTRIYTTRICQTRTRHEFQFVSEVSNTNTTRAKHEHDTNTTRISIRVVFSDTNTTRNRINLFKQER